MLAVSTIAINNKNNFNSLTFSPKLVATLSPNDKISILSDIKIANGINIIINGISILTSSQPLPHTLPVSHKRTV